MQELKKEFEQLGSLLNEINVLTIELSEGNFKFFSESSLNVRFSSPEACFSQLISWCYGYFVELCGPSHKFMKKRLQIDGVVLEKDVYNFDETIHAMRTCTQHNIDLSSAR